MTAVPYEEMDPRSRPILQKCCFFVPLKTSCFILGYLNLAICIMSILGLTAVTILSGQMSTRNQFIFDDDDQISTKISADSSYFTNLTAVLAVFLIGKLMWLGILIICLVGLHKKRPGHIELYVVFATVRVIIGLIALAVVAFLSTEVDIEKILVNLCDLLLSAYFIVVYKSYATQLKNDIQSTPSVFQIMQPDISQIYPTKPEVEEVKIKY